MPTVKEIPLTVKETLPTVKETLMTVRKIPPTVKETLPTEGQPMRLCRRCPCARLFGGCRGSFSGKEPAPHPISVSLSGQDGHGYACSGKE